MLQFIQNNAQLPLLLKFLLIGGIFAIGLYELIVYSKAAKKYIVGEADGRMPSLFSFVFVFFISITWYAYIEFTGHRMVETTILPRILFFFFITQCLRGRLIGFPSTKLSKTTRLGFYTFLDICNVMITFLVLAFYPHRVNDYEIVTMKHVADDILALTTNQSGVPELAILSMIISGLSLFFGAMIVVFDEAEHRSAKTRKYNILCFFVPTILFFLINFLPAERFWFRAWASCAILICSLVLMVFYLKKERLSSIRRATSNDANVRLIDEAMRRLTTIQDSARWAQLFNTIKSLLVKNESTQKIIFQRRYRSAETLEIVEKLKLEIANE